MRVFEDWISVLATQPAAPDRPGLCDQLATVARLRTAVEAFEARLVAAVHALDDDGADASAVARSVARCSQRESDRRARRADTLTELPSAADAMTRGELSAEHLDALGRAVEATSAEAVEGSGLVHETGRRNADQAACQVRDWTRSRQSDRDLQRRYAARRLHIFEGDDDMTVLHGEFDPVTGRRIRRATGVAADRLFHADGGRGAANDVRSSAQRRADALAQLLGVGDGPAPAAASEPCRPVRHQLLVLTHLDDDRLSGASLVDGTPLPQAVLERLACGADLFGLVMSQGGEPLWAGRRVRLATDAQWRALVARDRGCVICDADPAWCEGPRQPFGLLGVSAAAETSRRQPFGLLGVSAAAETSRRQPALLATPGRGATDIDNLALVCRHHHHLVHDLDWQLTRADDGSWTLLPP